MDHRQTLTEELARRQARNPKYSLRAFANALTISPTALSQVMNGLRSFRQDAAERVAETLGLSPVERDAFLKSAVGKNGIRKKGQVTKTHSELDLDFFELISEWYYIAILNLARLTPTIEFSTEKIAARLGLDQSTCSDALERLKRLQLVANRAGKLSRTSADLVLPGGRSSAAVRKFHRQNLERAINALDLIPVEDRDYSSITVAFDTKKMSKARQLIAKFRDQFAKMCSVDGDIDHVYTMSIQLFPQDSGKKL